ncbi:protein takeout-like isoform X2 [Pectinophora gossypiella]|nr:protein takeout-like isoform X2 [Pectinophora gossypiella]
MAGGIKDLGVPAVDPYHQKELRVEYKNNQIAVKMTMRDIYVYGLKTATVHDVRLHADEDRFLLEVDLTTPKVYVNGTYRGEGGWNSLTINTTGTFNTTMTDLTYTWKINGKPEKIDGETYVRIESFYMRPDLADLKSYITNDNPDTRELTNLGNDFANANWKALYRELLPYAQDNWNKIGIRVANKIFLKVPYDQLFPAKS